MNESWGDECHQYQDLNPESSYYQSPPPIKNCVAVNNTRHSDVTSVADARSDVIMT